MKRAITFLSVFLIATITMAQAPNLMSYQAVVRDASNTLITNQTVGVQISIRQGSPSGTAIFVETHAPMSNDNGLISLEVGAGTAITGVLAQINWGQGPYFIQTEIDPTGSTNYTIDGTSQLMSVPYALYAGTADSLAGGIQEVDGDVTNELQMLSISNDTIYLTNGGFVKVPGGFDGQYSSLTGAPTNVSSFTNDAGYISAEVDGSVTNELQMLSIGNDTIYLTNGGFVKLPAGFDGDFNSLSNIPAGLADGDDDTQLDSTDIANMGFITSAGPAGGTPEFLLIHPQEFVTVGFDQFVGWTNPSDVIASNGIAHSETTDRFTLKAGKVYELEACIYLHSTNELNGYGFIFHDLTNGVDLGIRSFVRPADYQTGSSFVSAPVTTAIVVPATDIEVALRDDFQGPGGFINPVSSRGYIKVTELR